MPGAAGSIPAGTTLCYSVLTMSIAKELEEATAEGEFEVRWTLVIDHPEKRSGGFKEVKPGTRTGQSKTFTSQKMAVSYAKGLVSGEEDFGSEYPTRVSVIQLYQGKSPRRIMKPVERERGADGNVKTIGPVRESEDDLGW